MSDHEEKNVNQPEENNLTISSLSIEELTASARARRSRRVDAMMGNLASA